MFIGYLHNTVSLLRGKIVNLPVWMQIYLALDRGIRWLEAIVNVLNNVTSTTGGTDEYFAGWIAVAILAAMLTQIVLILIQWLIRRITSKR